ncbi:MAG: DUF3108 domain-containing protein [Planctomycetes bacterium]|nr:DUF3108 domain-containing protein [Planctomycetota bacterium]
MARITRRVLLLLSCLSTLCIAQKAPQERPVKIPDYQIQHVPFKSGEKATYQFGWNGIPSASGWAKVTTRKWQGKEYYLVEVSTRTNPLVELLWKMRDHGWTLVDKDTLLPHRHEFYRQENEHRTKHVVLFDRVAKVALCVREKLDKNITDKIKLSYQFGFDPISLSYFLRGFDWKVGDVRRVELIEDNDKYLFTMKAVAKERITVAAGTFDAIKLEPTIKKLTGRKRKGGGKIKKANIWVTDDKRHIPIKLKSKVFIGHIYGDLIKLENVEEGRPKAK